jgi:hypothetical protein
MGAVCAVEIWEQAWAFQKLLLTMMTKRNASSQAARRQRHSAKSAPDEWSHLEGSLASGNLVKLGRTELESKVSWLTAAGQDPA